MKFGSVIYEQFSDGWQWKVYDGLAYPREGRTGYVDSQTAILLSEIARLRAVEKEFTAAAERWGADQSG
jgi:hypothetical protein